MIRSSHIALLVSLLLGLVLSFSAQERGRANQDDHPADRISPQGEQDYGRQGPPPWARAAQRNRRDVYTGALVNEGTGKCFDLTGGLPHNGNPIQLWDCTGVDAQSWRIVRLDSDEYLIVSQRTGKPVEVANGSRRSHATIQQWDYNGTVAQRWRIQPAGRGLVNIVNSGSGMCVDIQLVFGRKVVQAPCNRDLRTQNWRITNSDLFDRGGRRDDRDRRDRRREDESAALNGAVRYHGQITSRSSRKCLDINEPNTGERAYAQQWNCSQESNQRWKVIDLGGDEFALQLDQGGLVLDVANGSRDNGALVHQMRWDGSSSQRWRLRSMPGGAYEFVNESSGKCLDVRREQEFQNGARLQMWDCHGSNNQQWVMQ